MPEQHNTEVTLRPVKSKNIHNQTGSAISVPGNLVAEEGNHPHIGFPHGEIVTSQHGRSTALKELRYPILEVDEFGIPFGSLDYKGSRFENIEVQRDIYSVGGLRIRGLMLGTYIPRIISASSYARRQGIATERLLKVEKIEELPFEGKYVPVSEWKSLTKRMWEQKLAANPKALGADAQTSLQGIDKLFKEDFVIATRETQVPLRLGDALYTKNQTDLGSFLKPVFHWLYAVKRQLPQNFLVRNHPDRILNPTDSDDLVHYFGNLLPSNIGTELGVMHRNGIAATFTHLGNWTGVGSLVDTDSWFGKPLGDAAISQRNIITDVDSIKSEYINLLSDLNQKLSMRNYPADAAMVNLFGNYFSARAIGKPTSHKEYESMFSINMWPEERNSLKRDSFALADRLIEENI